MAVADVVDAAVVAAAVDVVAVEAKTAVFVRTDVVVAKKYVVTVKG